MRRLRCGFLGHIWRAAAFDDEGEMPMASICAHCGAKGPQSNLYETR